MNLTGKCISFARAGAIMCLLLLLSVAAVAQTGSIKGRVWDKQIDEALAGARIQVIGTYGGAIADEDGNFEIKNLPPGDYSVKIVFSGYAEKIKTGVKVVAGQATTIDLEMSDAGMRIDVIIEGEADLIDLEKPTSGMKLDGTEIRDGMGDNVQEIAQMSAGISLNPDGIQARGGRVYEMRFRVDDVDAKDPLAGTGFGVDVGSSALGELEVTTGGGDAETGNATSGLISAKIREGGDKLFVAGSWNRDNLFFNSIGKMSWNTDDANISIGGPIPFTKKKLSFFISGETRLTDTYFGSTARQLHSSLFAGNDSMFAPRQDNHWGNTVKLALSLKGGAKITLTNQHSLNINQNSRSLQIVGNDAIMTPGFPYIYSLNLDNSNTYTHSSNLTALNFKKLLDSTWTFSVTVGRLFTNLRADANGKPFRESTVDRLNDPQSIVTAPVSVFNPGDSIVYVFPGPGLYNNGGIGTLWHDHFAQEYTLKYKFVHQSRSKVHMITMGHEHKEQHYQWIDVTRPWVGAPIVINDSTTTPSTSVGSSSDVWAAKPATGGFFFQDDIEYKGIIASVGMRYEYWAPGKFADDAVNNPDAPVIDEIREEYKKRTTAFLGRRYKSRILPKLRVTFPIKANTMVYFSYGHSLQLPHPRFVYAGLDPVYQDRSFLSNLGNPNINPEVTVAYEIGLKSKVTENLALTVAAFYNDKFDYIVSRQILIKDQTGRFVEKTFYINQDYARIRGLEIGIIRRVGKMLKIYLNGGYQIATGKSNTAAESALQIKNQGFVNTTQERYLAWDRPFDLKFSLNFKPDTSVSLFTIPLKGFRFFVSSTFKSGLRYTPYVLTDTASSGRPMYEQDITQPFSKIAAPWFWTDFKLSRDFYPGKKNKQQLSVYMEFKNIFNNKNSQIINGVTGKAYREGDPLPLEYRDPQYPDPQDNGVPPFNPARFLQPRQMMFGVSFAF
jgi:outer membrane receptor protein involved in Fe transport